MNMIHVDITQKPSSISSLSFSDPGFPLLWPICTVGRTAPTGQGRLSGDVRLIGRVIGAKFIRNRQNRQTWGEICPVYGSKLILLRESGDG
jgi:hypothetical protein